MSSLREPGVAAEPADGGHNFVVVAGRLPVDRVEEPDGETSWRPSPGGLVTALEPVMREAGGVWIGWSGDAGPAPGPFEANGFSPVGIGLSPGGGPDFYEGFLNATLDRLVRRCGPGARAVRGQRLVPGRDRPVRRGGPGLLRGFLQRHAVAAVPRRHRAAAVPPPLVGSVRRGQPAVRGSGRHARGPRRDRVDPRLSAPARPPDAPRPAQRRPDRLLQPHPVPRL